MRAVDPEARLPAAIEALGPVMGRDVAVVDALDGPGPRRLLASGAWVRTAPYDALDLLPDASADVMVAWRTGFSPVADSWGADLSHAARVLRAEGRLLVVKDYGRDEVTRLLGDDERARQLIAFSHPKGPFLQAGFRVRVLHCWWRWETLEAAERALWGAFGDEGRAVARGMRRPRLAHKVAIYHADASLLGGMAA